MYPEAPDTLTAQPLSANLDDGSIPTHELEAEAISLGHEILEAKLNELENGIHHLRRSNTELAQALRESGGEDPDFRAAINENVVIILRKQAEAMEMRANVNNDRAARGLPPLPPSTLNSMSSTNAGAESSDLSAPTLNSAPTDQSNSLASSEATLETDAPVTAEANPDSSAAPIGLDNRTDGGGLFL